MVSVKVYGSIVDDETRCAHYSGPTDVIAIKFRCCGDYYPCHLCHEESAGHPATQWLVTERDAHAVLCGVCDNELTIDRYLEVTGCPACGAQFNPGCALHKHYYFEGP